MEGVFGYRDDKCRKEMTREQVEIALALGNVRFLPASFDKRFAQNMHGLASVEPEKELTEKQVEWLYRILYKYRKQVPVAYEKYKGHPFCGKKPRARYVD